MVFVHGRLKRKMPTKWTKNRHSNTDFPTRIG
nr:MAG TPA: hypothetical protein [Caudoviricetes sp.]